MAQSQITQDVLDSFVRTVDKYPNASDSELMELFEEFGGDAKTLDDAKSYYRTRKKFPNSDLSEINALYPEFFGETQQKQPTQQPEQKTPTVADAYGNITGATQNLEERKAEQETKAHNAAVDAAQLPMTTAEQWRQDQLNRLEWLKIPSTKQWYMENGKLVYGASGEGYVGGLETQQKVEELKSKQPEHLKGEAKTFDEAQERVLTAAIQSTDYGKEGYDAYTKLVQTKKETLDKREKADFNELQGKVYAGTMTVDEAQKELQRRHEEYQKQLEDFANDSFQGFAKNVFEKNQDYLEKEYRRLGNQTIDRQITELSAEAMDKIKGILKNTEGYSSIEDLHSASPEAAARIAERGKIGYYNQALEYLKDAKKIKDAAAQGPDALGKILKNFFGGLGENIADMDTWDIGIGQLTRTGAFKKIIDKLEANGGDESVLTDDEKLMMQAGYTYLESCALNSSRINRAYKAGQTTAESIPFMLEFAMGFAGAAESAVARGIVRFGTKMFGKVAGNSARYMMRETIGHIVGLAAGTVLQTTLFGIPKIEEGSLQRQLGQVNVDMNDETGGFKFGGIEAGTRQSESEALTNSIIDNGVETASEMFFTQFNPLTHFAGNWLGATSMFQKVGSKNWVRGLIHAYNNPTFRNLRQRMQFGGYIGEVMEEEVGGLMRFMCSDVNDLKSAGLDKDSQIDTLLGLLPTSLFFLGIGGAGAVWNGIKTKYNTDKLLKSVSSETERKFFQQLINSSTSSGEFGEKAYDYIRGIINNGDLTQQQKQADLAVVAGKYYDALSEDVKKAADDIAKEQYGVLIENFTKSITHKDGKMYGTVDNTGHTVFITDGVFSVKENKDGVPTIRIPHGKTVTGVMMKEDGTLSKEIQFKQKDLHEAVQVQEGSKLRDLAGAAARAHYSGNDTFEFDGKTYSAYTLQETEPAKKREEQPAEQSAEPKPIKKIIAVDNGRGKLVQATVIYDGANVYYNEDGSIDESRSGDFSIKNYEGKEVSGKERAKWIAGINAVLMAERADAQQRAQAAIDEKVKAAKKAQEDADYKKAVDEARKNRAKELVEKIKEKDGWIDTEARDITPEMIFWYTMTHADVDTAFKDAVRVCIQATLRKAKLNTEEGAKEIPDETKRIAEIHRCDSKLKGYEEAVKFWVDDTDTAHNVGQFRIAVAEGVKKALNITEDEAPGTIEGEAPRTNDVYEYIETETTKRDGVTTTKFIPYRKVRSGKIKAVTSGGVFIDKALVNSDYLDADGVVDVQVLETRVGENGVIGATVMVKMSDGSNVPMEVQLNEMPQVPSDKVKPQEPATTKLEARSDEIYDHIKVETTKNENTGLTDYVYIPYAKAEEGQEPQPVKLAGKFINRNIITGGDAKEFIDEHPNDIRDIQVTNVQETSEKDIFVANVIITTKDGQSAGYDATLNTLPKVGSTKREQKPSTPPTEAPETKTPKKPKATPKWPNPFDENIALVKTANGRVVFKSRAEVKDGETEYEPRTVYFKEGSNYIPYVVRSAKQKISLNSTVPVVDANGVEKSVYANQLYADANGDKPFVENQNTKLKVDNFGQVAAYPVYTSANGTQFTLQDLLTEHRVNPKVNDETKRVKTESMSGYEYVRQQVEAENPDDPNAVEMLHKNIKHILDMWNVLAGKLLDSKGYNKAMLLAYRYLYYKSSVETQYNLAAEAEKEGKDASKFYAEAHKIDANMDGMVDFSVGVGFDPKNLKGKALNNPLYRLASMIEITKDMPEMKGVDFDMQLPEDIEKALKAKIITAKQIEEARAKFKSIASNKKASDEEINWADKIEKEMPEVKTAWAPLTREQGENGYEKVKPLLKQEAGETRRNRKMSKEQEALKSFRDLCQQAIDALRANDKETFNKLNAQIGKTVTEHMTDKVNKFANQMVSYQNTIRSIIATAFPEVAKLATLHHRLDNTLATIAEKKQKVENLQLRLDKVNARLDGLDAMLVETEGTVEMREKSTAEKKRLEEQLAEAKEDAARAPMNNPDQLRAVLNEYIAQHPEAEKQYQEMTQATYPENGLRLDLMGDELADVDKSDWSKRHGEIIVKFLRKMGIKIEIVSGDELKEMAENGGIVLEKGKVIYGLANGKQVWLNRDTLSSNSPIHESVHLWIHAYAESHPQEWKKMVAVLKKTDMWNKVSNAEPYATRYKGNDSAMANEVMAYLVGNLYSKKGIFGDSRFENLILEDDSVMARVKLAVYKFLHWLSDMFNYGIKRNKDYTLEIRKMLAMPINDIIAYGGERGAVIAEANKKQKQLDWFNKQMGFDMMTRRTDETIRGWLADRGDLSAAQINAVVHAIDELETNKLQLAAGHWYAKGTIRIPEDLKKIRQAVAVAERAKVDPMRYDSPMAIIEAFPEIEIKEKPIDPNTVPTLYKSAEFDNGIVIYDVDEGEESRQNMRAIINTHFGKDSSPWCLLQGDENGDLTEESEYYWNHYKAYPKQVAFKDGHLVAFSANDNSNKVWWDRMDMYHEGISVGKVDLGEGKMQERQFVPSTRTYDDIGPIVRISTDGKIQETWNRNGFRVRTEIITANYGTVEIGYVDGTNKVETIKTKQNDTDMLIILDRQTGEIIGLYAEKGYKTLASIEPTLHKYFLTTDVGTADKGYIRTEFDDNGNLVEIEEENQNGRVTISIGQTTTTVDIEKHIGDSGLYSYGAAKIELFGDRVTNMDDVDAQTKYQFDAMGNVIDVFNYISREHIIVTVEGKIGIQQTDEYGNKMYVAVEESNPRYEEIFGKIAAGEAALAAYQEQYEGLLEYAQGLDEKFYSDTSSEILKTVLADAFGLSSTDNILSADQNGVLDGLDLMTDLDMMVDNGVQFQTTLSELNSRSQRADKRLTEGVNEASAALANASLPMEERASLAHRAIMRMLDRTEGLRLMQNSIAAYREMLGLPPMESIYDVRTQMDSANAAAMNKIKEVKITRGKELRDIVNKLAEIVSKSDFYKQHAQEVGGKNPTKLTPIEFIGRYLIARNNWERADEAKDRGAKEFAARMGMDMIQFAETFQNTYDEALITDLWDKLRAMTDYTLDVSVNAGMITQEEYERLKAKKFYVPQRGFWDRVNPDRDEQEGAEDYMPRIGRTGKAQNKLNFMHKAEGGESLAENPLVYIYSDVEEAIVKAEHNLVKQKLFYLLKENSEWCQLPEVQITVPMQVSYRVKEDGTIEKVIDGVTAEERAEIREIERKITELHKKLGTSTVEAEREALRELISELEEKRDEIAPEFSPADTRAIFKKRKKRNSIGVLIDGYQCEIIMPERFALTADAMNGVEDTEGKLAAIKTASSFLAAQFTVNNPAFWAVNLARDLGFVTLKGTTEYGPMFTARFYKNLAACQGQLNKYLWTGKMPEAVDGKIAEYLAEFLNNGANTGLMNNLDLAKFRYDVQKMNPEYTEGMAKAWDVTKTAAKWVALQPVANYLNEWSELTSRFAIYAAMRDSGYDEIEATNAAHNLSVNFNRRGLGSQFLNLFSSMTVFVNATLQGTTGFWRTFGGDQKHPIKKAMIAASMMAMGPALLGFLNTLLCPDDDDNEIVVTSWDRDNYIILPQNLNPLSGTPGGGRIALAQELRPFWCIGVNIAMAVKGRRTKEERTNSILSSFFTNGLPLPQNITNALSLYVQTDNPWEALRAIVTPTFLETINQLADHKNFLGGKLRYDIDDIPEYEMAPNESAAAKDIAYAMYLLGGGDEDVPSKHKMDDEGNLTKLSNRVDINPKEVRNYMFMFPSGTLDAWLTFWGIAHDVKDAFERDYEFGRNIRVKDIPVVNRFYHQNNPGMYRYGLTKEAKALVSEWEQTMKGAENAMERFGSIASTTDNENLAERSEQRVEKAVERYSKLASQEIMWQLKSALDTYNDISIARRKRDIGLMSDAEAEEVYGVKTMEEFDALEKEHAANLRFLLFQIKGLTPTEKDMKRLQIVEE